ncbi:g2796 [Coccomyxa elongata]
MANGATSAAHWRQKSLGKHLACRYSRSAEVGGPAGLQSLLYLLPRASTIDSAVQDRSICSIGRTVKVRNRCGIAPLGRRSGSLSARLISACRADCTYYVKKADLPVGQVHILPLAGGDLAAATVVLTRSFSTSPDNVTVSLSRVDEFLRRLQDPSKNGTFFVARLVPKDASLLPSGRAHRVVGTAAVTFSKEEDAEVSGDWPVLPADSAHVTNMAVDQKLRKQGIARLLLATCEDHARKAGWSSISLAVHVDNVPARQLYLSAGYKEVQPMQANAPLFMRPWRRSQHSIMKKELAA